MSIDNSKQPVDEADQFCLLTLTVTDAFSAQRLPKVRITTLYDDQYRLEGFTNYNGQYSIRFNPKEITSEIIDVFVISEGYTQQIFGVCRFDNLVNVHVRMIPYDWKPIREKPVRYEMGSPGTKIITKEEIRKSPYR